MTSVPVRQDSPLVVLAGPTGVGKSALALALAERYGGEILSVDSAQVYRGLDIGTDKPGGVERARVPHHLLDLRDPSVDYSAGAFAADARRAIEDVWARGRLPFLVGGTFLYLRAFFGGLGPDLPPADPEMRRRIEREAETIGWEALHERLARFDPKTAARIHPHDKVRITRALEIRNLSGREPSAHRPVAFAEALPVLRLVIAVHDREAHRRRLDARLSGMLARGFLDEVRALHERGDLDSSRPALRAVGYRQLWEHCEGSCGYEEAVARARIATAQLAKRQSTWIRSLRGWRKIAWEGEASVDTLARHVDDFLEHTARDRRGTSRGGLW
jgi:tRNA dimethylallyltransferase